MMSHSPIANALRVCGPCSWTQTLPLASTSEPCATNGGTDETEDEKMRVAAMTVTADVSGMT